MKMNLINLFPQKDPEMLAAFEKVWKDIAGNQVMFMQTGLRIFEAAWNWDKTKQSKPTKER